MMSFLKKIAGLRNIFLWLWASLPQVFGYLLIILGAYLCYQDKAASGSASFGAGILSWILGNLEKFESFKGLGIEAKMHSLQLATAEAEKVRGELADLSKELSEKIMDIEKNQKFANAMAVINANQQFG